MRGSREDQMPSIAQSKAIRAAVKTRGRRIRTLDLFCGAGGSSWGARNAGASIVAAFDLWSLAGEVHRENFPESVFIQGRLEEMSLAPLVKKFGPIDLILASPECTNHSPAKGNKPRCNRSKDTAFQVVRFADAFKPRWIVIENVVNMRTWTKYSGFREALEGLGYKLREQVLNASHFGVPQSRRRLYLVGDREQMPPSVAPDSHKPTAVRPHLKLNGTYRWKPLFSPKRAVATLERARRGMKVVGKSAPFLVVYYGSDGSGGWQAVNRPLRTITTLDRFALVKPDRTHGHVMRMLQVPELQAAMGMPMQMRFEVGTRRDRIKLLGNAVCPPVMQTIVQRLTKPDRHRCP